MLLNLITKYFVSSVNPPSDDEPSLKYTSVPVTGAFATVIILVPVSTFYVVIVSVYTSELDSEYL